MSTESTLGSVAILTLDRLLPEVLGRSLLPLGYKLAVTRRSRRAARAR